MPCRENANCLRSAFEHANTVTTLETSFEIQKAGYPRILRKGLQGLKHAVNPQKGSGSKTLRAAHSLDRTDPDTTVRPPAQAAASQRTMRFLHPSSDLSRITHCRVAIGQAHLNTLTSPAAANCQSRAHILLRARRRKQLVLRATAVQEVIPTYRHSDSGLSTQQQDFHDIKVVTNCKRTKKTSRPLMDIQIRQGAYTGRGTKLGACDRTLDKEEQDRL